MSDEIEHITEAQKCREKKKENTHKIPEKLRFSWVGWLFFAHISLENLNMNRVSFQFGTYV